MLKMEVFAPMPMARDRIAAMEKPGFLARAAEGVAEVANEGVHREPGLFICWRFIEPSALEKLP